MDGGGIEVGKVTLVVGVGSWVVMMPGFSFIERSCACPAPRI